MTVNPEHYQLLKTLNIIDYFKLETLFMILNPKYYPLL